MVMRPENWFLFSLLLVAVAESVVAQGFNWGNKVRCFVVHNEIVCPGCNSRAGLSCPRIKTPLEDCDGEYKQQPPATTLSTETPEVTTESTTDTETTQTEQAKTPTDVRIIEKRVQDVPATTPWDMEIFLYQILENFPKRKLNKRDADQDIEPEICRWNGDCPCPQICCRTSEGCEKRCRMGIRLPPPWGTG